MLTIRRTQAFRNINSNKQNIVYCKYGRGGFLR